jgi:hypothetical protein
LGNGAILGRIPVLENGAVLEKGAIFMVRLVNEPLVGSTKCHVGSRILYNTDEGFFIIPEKENES